MCGKLTIEYNTVREDGACLCNSTPAEVAIFAWKNIKKQNKEELLLFSYDISFGDFYATAAQKGEKCDTVSPKNKEELEEVLEERRKKLCYLQQEHYAVWLDLSNFI